jgi:hypothetical protein
MVVGEGDDEASYVGLLAFPALVRGVYRTRRVSNPFLYFHPIKKQMPDCKQEWGGDIAF